jgi:diadenosine tetraphosphate (Ap4A) HIT family hydrolase
MGTCSLCSPDLEPLIWVSDHWQLVLNRNQNLLGKSFLVLRRHCEVVEQLTPEEWMDLRQQLIRTTEAVCQAFQPDHFNYAFLQNQEQHVHLHVIPRYEEVRTFGGISFDDPDYPDHYAVPASPRYLSDDQMAALAAQLRSCLPR